MKPTGPIDQATIDNEKSTSKLPEGWVRDFDTVRNKVYYYNSQTAETSWERTALHEDQHPARFMQSTFPTEADENETLLTEHPATSLPQSNNLKKESYADIYIENDQWSEAWDRSTGKKYYFHPKTQEVQWNRPSSLPTIVPPNMDVLARQRNTRRLVISIPCTGQKGF